VDVQRDPAPDGDVRGGGAPRRIVRTGEQHEAGGRLVIALVGNGFDLLGIDPPYRQIALGLILLLAVGIDAWSRLHKR
jgi:hypothetical protein